MPATVQNVVNHGHPGVGRDPGKSTGNWFIRFVQRTSCFLSGIPRNDEYCRFWMGTGLDVIGYIMEQPI
jgi:hypothetical protein